jgi:hypothetical protein
MCGALRSFGCYGAPCQSTLSAMRHLVSALVEQCGLRRSRSSSSCCSARSPSPSTDRALDIFVNTCPACGFGASPSRHAVMRVD